MNRKRPSFVLASGLLVFAVTQIVYHTYGMPDFIRDTLIGVALGLEILGFFNQKFKDSKFRQWKLRLLRRNE